jgi:AraC-like DNA-binding protein
MGFNFLYKTLDAAAVFNHLKKAYGIAGSTNRINIPAALGVGYTQKLRLLSDIDILISEYTYAEDIFFKHEPEKSGNLILWFDMAITSGQQFSVNNHHHNMNAPEQFYAYLGNSAFSFSHLRNKGTRGKSIMIFLPHSLMEQFFSPAYLQEVLKNYYAVLCKGLFFAGLSAAQKKNVNAVFYQWQQNNNVVSITKNVHQLIEWFFTGFFKKFAAINEKVSDEETADLLAIETLLTAQAEYAASPDINLLKSAVMLPFAAIESKFRKLHNKTLYQYFKEQKIHKGMGYLREGKNVSEAAFELGYANPGNFSSSFKKVYGLTADEFRRRLQNN